MGSHFFRWVAVVRARHAAHCCCRCCGDHALTALAPAPRTDPRACWWWMCAHSCSQMLLLLLLLRSRLGRHQRQRAKPPQGPADGGIAHIHSHSCCCAHSLAALLLLLCSRLGGTGASTPHNLQGLLGDGQLLVSGDDQALQNKKGGWARGGSGGRGCGFGRMGRGRVGGGAELNHHLRLGVRRSNTCLPPTHPHAHSYSQSQTS